MHDIKTLKQKRRNDRTDGMRAIMRSCWSSQTTAAAMAHERRNTTDWRSHLPLGPKPTVLSMESYHTEKTHERGPMPALQVAAGCLLSSHLSWPAEVEHREVVLMLCGAIWRRGGHPRKDRHGQATESTATRTMTTVALISAAVVCDTSP